MIGHEVLDPVGVRVRSLDLAEVGSSDVDDLVRLAGEHGVVVVPDQHLDDAQFVRFLELFGRLTFTAGETPVAGFPDLNVVSNVGRSTPPRSVFHVDTSYIVDPPTYTALRAVSIPSRGGQTLFTNQYRAFETLPVGTRVLLAGRTIRHRVISADGSETSADHPALLRHPVSGRTALYVSTPERCVSVSGMSDDDGADLIAFLYEHSTDEANVYRHQWQPGDVVLWDNRCVLHRADHSGVVGDRVMHRGMATAHAG